MNANRKMSKKMISSSLAAVTLITALGSIDPGTEETAAAVSIKTTPAVATELLSEGYATAGMVTVLSSLPSEAFAKQEVSVSDAGLVAVASQNTSDEAVDGLATLSIVEKGAETEAVPAEETASTEDAEWSSRLMADVEDYLTIRASSSSEAAAVGKLYKGDVAQVISSEGEWTKVTSGNVTGYVANDYTVTGDEAKALADEVCDTVVTSTVAGLRIREDASEDAKILTVMSDGATATLNEEAEAQDGWVAVTYRGVEGYVSEEYAESEMELGEAISVEEEQAAIEAAKKAEEEKAAKAAASQTTELTTTQNAPVAASYDDVTLLAALIQCEAGNEPYEGQVAVGAVVMNRLRSGRYGSTIYDVIYAPYQFGPARTGGVASAAASGPKASCIQAAQEALSGVSNIGGCTCFHRNDGRSGTVIGNHVFY